jgi:hypothetical protein
MYEPLPARESRTTVTLPHHLMGGAVYSKEHTW